MPWNIDVDNISFIFDRPITWNIVQYIDQSDNGALGFDN